MKYDRNKIKDIFRDGISCLYLDEEQDDFCNFVEKLQQEKEDLIKWLKEERIVDKEEDMKIARDEKNKQFIYGMLIAYKSVLEKLGE